MLIEITVDDHVTRLGDTKTSTDRMVAFARSIQTAIDNHNETYDEKFEVSKFEMENSF